MPVYHVKPTAPLINRRLAKLYGVVAAWPFSEGGGTVLRDVAGGRSGTMVGGTATGTPYGPGISFGGSDYASFGDTLQFDRTTPFSGWVLLRYTSAADANIISKQLNSGSFAGYGLAIGHTGKIEFFLYNGSGIIVDSALAYNDGSWHWVGFSYDGSSSSAGVALYVDGAPVVLTGILNNLTSGTVASSTPFQISGRAGANGCFAGDIAVAVLANAALPASFFRSLSGPDSWRLYQGGAVNVYAFAQPVPVGASSNGNFIDVRLGGI